MTRQYPEWVQESSFGKWFLNTDIWVSRVIQVALNDLVQLMDNPDQQYDVILDVGVGFGNSLWNLDQKFHPKKIIGLDGYGLEICERVALEVTAHDENIAYLTTKRDRMGHLLRVNKEGE